MESQFEWYGYEDYVAIWPGLESSLCFLQPVHWHLHTCDRNYLLQHNKCSANK